MVRKESIDNDWGMLFLVSTKNEHNFKKAEEAEESDVLKMLRLKDSLGSFVCELLKRIWII
jgi:flavin reductase (DIM6/NTAB) family NADH-FMN oxidoreductase RutF